MAYFIDLFSPETHDTFSTSARAISGFRLRQKGMADRIKPGDKFICYLTRLSRWCGVLDIVDGPFIDHTPVFAPENDPFVVRFKVKEAVWLPIDRAIPIHEPAIWKGLSFTKGLEKGSTAWTGRFRGSLARLEDVDGKFLADKLAEQAAASKPFPLTEGERRRVTTHKVNRSDKVVRVSVPDDAAPEPALAAEPEVRESTRMQALIAQIGASMGMSIWIPRQDRSSVAKEWKKVKDAPPILDRLPLNYDDATLRTIEQIDVIWLRRRSIVRAFEVEHTTSIYSGILRMADLLALQPNMAINLHIVAPGAKRDKVFQEIRRPVFSLLDQAPLAERCTYLSYESLKELAAHKHLSHLSDTVLEEYAEEAE